MSFCNVEFNSVVADVALMPLSRRDLDTLRCVADGVPVDAVDMCQPERLVDLGLVRIDAGKITDDVVATPLLEGARVRGLLPKLGLR